MARFLLLIMCVGCGGEGRQAAEYGPIQQACFDVAERMCCAYDPSDKEESGDSAYLSCWRNAFYKACYGPVGTAPEAGCAGGVFCVRSSVDFAACNAAIDALGTCVRGCGDGYVATPDCAPLPMECVSIACRTRADGCAEEPWVDS